MEKKLKVAAEAIYEKPLWHLAIPKVLMGTSLQMTDLPKFHAVQAVWRYLNYPSILQPN